MQQSPNKSLSHSIAYYTIIQKPPFCRAKVWFLACKKGVFGMQEVGFCIAKVWFLFFKRVFFVLQYIVPCPRNTLKWRCDFPPLVLQCRYFYLLYPTFRHVHPVGVGADLSCPCPRNSTKWRCVFPPLILQFCYFIYCTPRFATSTP